MSTRRFKMVATDRLRGWLAALECCPKFLPFVVDLRIAVRNELWLRSTEEARSNAWFSAAVRGWQ